jgi:peptidyl-prolyl cis-trans isomerase SurA
MKAGDVTEVIRTPSGFNIFKLVDVRGAGQVELQEQVHVRHILMQPTAVEDEETVRQKLSRIRERVLKGEDFAAIASVSSTDKGSATQGGDLGWASAASFVPEFTKNVESLQIDEISQPFKTPYGWHIAQLLGRRTYDASTDVTRNKCMSQLREARAEEETEIWARRLRDEAYVEYR